MPYPNLQEIFRKQEENEMAFLTNSISVTELLQRYDALASEVVAIGEVYDSLDALEQRLVDAYIEFNGPFLSRSFARGRIEHEGEHAAIAARYGINSRFIYIHERNLPVCTWYYDLPEKAASWTWEQMDEFLLSSKNVKEPSEQDRKYRRMKETLEL